jgi:hypothetical protein
MSTGFAVVDILARKEERAKDARKNKEMGFRKQKLCIARCHSVIVNESIIESIIESEIQ